MPVLIMIYNNAYYWRYQIYTATTANTATNNKPFQIPNSVIIDVLIELFICMSFQPNIGTESQ